MPVINYFSADSGAWVSDKFWKTLAAKGWTVWWFADEKGLQGVDKASGRYKGSLASCASKYFDHIGQATDEFKYYFKINLDERTPSGDQFIHLLVQDSKAPLPPRRR